MPTIPLHLAPAKSIRSTDNPLPHLLHTPSGLAILEIQGTLNLPPPNPSTPATLVGRLVFPLYDPDDITGSKAWQKTVHLYVGRHQRLTGEVKKLGNPIAVIRKREEESREERRKEEVLEIVDVVYWKIRSSEHNLISMDVDYLNLSMESLQLLRMTLEFLYQALRIFFPTLVLALVAKIVSTAIYNIYFHPLRHFPGPKLAAATPLPFAWRLINGRMVDWTYHLHTTYGEVVRILPDELSFTGSSAWQEIFTGRPQLPKPEIGSLMPPNGVRPISSITTTEDHTRQRKILSYAFSDRAVKEQEYILQEYSDLLINCLRDQDPISRKEGQGVDISNWFRFASLDIIGDLLFGESFHSLQSADHHPWVATIFKGVKLLSILTVFQYFPPMATVVKYLMPSSAKAIALKHLNYTRSLIDKRIARKTDRPDIMKFILENNHAGGMHRDEIDSTTQLLILAGSETSAVTMTGVIWFSLSNPHVMTRLQREIRGAFKQMSDITAATASTLPYLHAVINETMRLHPGASVAVPRLVDRQGVVICGRLVPPGTRVGIPPKTVYRLRSHFVEPESFLPDRWLPDTDPRFAADNKAAFEPFLVGPRNCIGKTLAWTEMKIILCKVIWTFDLALTENNDGDWTDQRVFLLNENKPLWVNLAPRSLMG